MLVGMGMHAMLPPTKVLATLEGLSGNIENIIQANNQLKGGVSDGGDA